MSEWCTLVYGHDDDTHTKSKWFFFLVVRLSLHLSAFQEYMKPGFIPIHLSFPPRSSNFFMCVNSECIVVTSRFLARTQVVRTVLYFLFAKFCVQTNALMKFNEVVGFEESTVRKRDIKRTKDNVCDASTSEFLQNMENRTSDAKNQNVSFTLLCEYGITCQTHEKRKKK